MEIKILCNCGTKFKFDVEPVNGRMPSPVSCPGCGADSTAQANEILAGMPMPAPAIPVAAPAPVASASPAAAVPPPSPQSGLRINRPPPAAAPAQPAMVAAPPPPPTSSRPVYRQPQESKKSVWKTVLTVLLVCLVLLGAGYKIYRRVRSVVNLASVIQDISKNVSEATQFNLTASDQVILYVRHTNHTEIAQECVAYWKEKLHRNLKTMKAEEETGDGGEIVVMPEHNGYVRLMSGLEWKEPEFEAVAKHLSTKFNTMVFDEKDVDFSGAYVFGVYDQGTNVFHARMDVTMNVNDPQEKVTTTGNDWALAHGYKPGEKGFSEFNIKDADDLTKQLGMKLWDEKEDGPTNFVVLKDPVMAKAVAQQQ